MALGGLVVGKYYCGGQDTEFTRGFEEYLQELGIKSERRRETVHHTDRQMVPTDRGRGGDLHAEEGMTWRGEKGQIALQPRHGPRACAGGASHPRG